jgi:hypothetical protein
VIIVVVILLLLLLSRKSYYVETMVSFDNSKFKVAVSDKYADYLSARDLLREAVNRLLIFKKFLKSKYGIKSDKNNPTHEIDIDKKTNNQQKRKVMEMIYRFLKRFDPNSLRELHPNNSGGETAYTENKGDLIMICIRTPDGKLQDINTLMFILLHEVTHIITTELDHPVAFWNNFLWIIKNAVQAGIYNPVNYAKNNVTYCGHKITFNPLYDWKGTNKLHL